MNKKPKKFYITTSIAYTNSFPHLGFALELVQADIISRHHRILGEEVFFLTGTDEHGQKICWAAEKANKKPKDFTDDLSGQFKQLTEKLNLSNDDFIRTTDHKRHWPAVQIVWNKIKENGDIYKKKYQGLYCVGCEAFITKKDLVDGKCKVHLKEPEKTEEENYFFKLSKYSSKIKELIEKDEIQIIPQERKNEMLSFIEQGLEDISFSRPSKDLKWGIPVPNDDSQTIYVWADALTNYISALDYPSGANFKKFWPADIHFLGKDILRFHAIIWPAMLLSLKLPLFKKIFVHGFITSAGQKMSKSLGNVIDPLELIAKYGADSVRYYLLREISSTEDGDFTYEKFEKRYNSDLASGLGNLTARIIALDSKLKNQKIILKKKNGEKKEKKSLVFLNPKILILISKTQKKCGKALREFKFNEALIAIWDLISFCDEYIEKEKPWEKSEKQFSTIGDLLIALKKIARMLKPFLPETSEKILNQLKAKKGQPIFPRLPLFGDKNSGGQGKI